MSAQVATEVAGSSVWDVLFVIVPVVLVVGAIYAGAARGRAASRHAHAAVPLTGQGA